MTAKMDDDKEKRFFLFTSTRRKTLWKACTWCEGGREREKRNLSTFPMYWSFLLIVKDQFFWQFHYFFSLCASPLYRRGFIEQCQMQTIVRIPLSVGIHTFPLLCCVVCRSQGGSEIGMGKNSPVGAVYLLIYFRNRFFRIFMCWERKN